ncbi:MAG TPA: 50S ribosomal protein L22 [Deltaproteobacteria bacterium]|nr:MAG: 50S ribosomal protein L22 [Deltaproteobacteria bacterium GWA2_45_12]HBF13582.1 50S ribosomal protein L22 [Deltaproteobacteria bacterium]
MEAKAKFTYIRQSPRKLRLVVDLVRGKGVQEALDCLKFQRKVGAVDVSKLIRSAVANALQKGGARADRLFVKTIMVDQAAIMKRFMPRAKGSASSIQKKLSHMTVVLDERI